MPEKYKKYEFCKDVNCAQYKNGCVLKDFPASWCPCTAKQFHKWLKENNFEIVKK